MHERLLWNVYLKKTLKELEIAFCCLLTCKNFIGHEFVYSFRHKRDYLFILETEMLNAEFLLSHLFHCPFESVSVITDLSPCMSTSNDFNWERINSDHTKICFKELSVFWKTMHQCTLRRLRRNDLCSWFLKLELLWSQWPFQALLETQFPAIVILDAWV